MISKAFNLAVKEWEWIRDNPVSKIPKEKENNERGRWLTEEEELRLLDRVFEKVLQRAGIEDFHFHDLRHTFATRLAQKGIDIYTIAKLLGHKDIRMTQRYAHHCPEILRTAIQVIEASDNLVTIKQNQIM